MSNFLSLVIDKHCLCLSLRTLTESLSAHEPNLVSAKIYHTQRSYLQVTHSPPHPSICLSFYCMSLSPHLRLSLCLFLSTPPPSLYSTCIFHCYSYMNLCSLSRGPHKLIKRGENLTLHIDHIPPDWG